MSASSPYSRRLREEVEREIRRSRRAADHLAQTEERIALVEEEIAVTNDQLAARRGDPKYARRAEQARRRAEEARVASRQLARSAAGDEASGQGRSTGRRRG